MTLSSRHSTSHIRRHHPGRAKDRRLPSPRSLDPPPHYLCPSLNQIHHRHVIPFDLLHQSPEFRLKLNVVRLTRPCGQLFQAEILVTPFVQDV